MKQKFYVISQDVICEHTPQCYNCWVAALDKPNWTDRLARISTLHLRSKTNLFRILRDELIGKFP